MPLNKSEIAAAIKANRKETGKFGEGFFSPAEIDTFAPAPSAEVRLHASSAELVAVISDFDDTEFADAEFDDLVDDFDRDHHGDLDGARVAALAKAEGLIGASTSNSLTGEPGSYLVILARTDAGGVSHSMATPFTTGNGERPTTAMVLNALLSDSAALNDVDSIDDWADQNGYDLIEEGPIVRMKWAEVQAQHQSLSSFLGDQLDAYLWDE